MTKTNRRPIVISCAAIAAAAVMAGLAAPTASAVAEPGTPNRDVHIGLDNDNAANTFIQPLGVAAKQHMDNTDVLVGRGHDDLLIGNRGSDTLVGGLGGDIMVGGPEGGTAPNSDVMVGDEGDDINIWAPGDGSDAFLGNEGYDTMVFAPFVKNADGSLKLEWNNYRTIPRVDIDGLPQFSCDIVRVPATQRLGFDFLVRFNAGGVPAVTVRQLGVETVLCPSAEVGKVKVADLTAAYPAFRTVSLKDVHGTVGAIVAPTS